MAGKQRWQDGGLGKNMVWSREGPLPKVPWAGVEISDACNSRPYSQCKKRALHGQHHRSEEVELPLPASYQGGGHSSVPRARAVTEGRPGGAKAPFYPETKKSRFLWEISIFKDEKTQLQTPFSPA